MSIQITAKNICKRFDRGKTTVIPDLSLTIRDGEFFTILGPSGCGKTTFLRMIAGFILPEAGEIYFDDKIVNDIPTQRRHIGMVFQNYAIFPHLTVRENISFGLKQRKMAGTHIKQKTDEILKLVGMEEYADRLPDRLSGGQQQRVALARAIVIHPNVLLMDEPLSNLDAKLRIKMRGTIRRLQKGVGITTIYVTHDQEEALAISDRIAVMSNGDIQQVDSPLNIYLRPANTFVATFIGFSNLFRGVIKLHEREKQVILNENCAISLPQLIDDIEDGMEVIVSMRPDEFEFADKGLKVKVLSSAFLGQTINYKVMFEDAHVMDIGDQNELTEAVKHVTTSFKTESEFFITPMATKVNVFTSDGKRSLIRDVVVHD